MTKAEVRQLLGEPSDTAGPADSKSAPATRQSPVDAIATSIMLMQFEWYRDMGYERWHYGDFEGWFDNLLEPSPDAYVVYFYPNGYIAKWREPLPEKEREAERARRQKLSEP